MLTPTVVTHTTTVRRGSRAPVTSPRSSARCSSCAMRHLCMPQGLALDDLPKLEALICTARSVRRGESLYRAGDPFDSLYAVRSGSLKTVMAHRDGREQVTGLRLAGDPLGIDGIRPTSTRAAPWRSKTVRSASSPTRRSSTCAVKPAPCRTACTGS
jgi:CRP/FNR family transcriptional regulator, anaerobic regulatory protein